MHKILFYNKFIIFLYMFRALCAHHQEVKIVLYGIWYHHTPDFHNIRANRSYVGGCVRGTTHKIKDDTVLLSNRHSALF